MFSSLITRMILMVGLPIILVNFSLLFSSASQQKTAALKQAEDLSLATTREQSTELQSLIEMALNSANLTSGVFRNVNDMNNPLDMGRESAALILKGMLGNDDKFAGVFSVWEPDAFDMMDVAYGGLPGNTEEGRFSPYWKSRPGDAPVLKVMSDAEINETGGWYEKFRQNPQPNLVWSAEGQALGTGKVLRAMTPIINDGQYLGVVGVDIGVAVLENMVAQWSNPLLETTVHLHTTKGELVAPADSEGSGHHGRKKIQKSDQGIHWDDDVLVICQLVESSLADTGLIVTMEMPRHILLEPMQTKLKRNVWFGFALILPTLLIVGFLSNGIWPGWFN